MSSLLVHIHTGPENPTKVALGMLMARGVTDVDIEGKGAQWAPPEKLVELAFGHDRVLTY